MTSPRGAVAFREILPVAASTCLGIEGYGIKSSK